MGFQFNGFHASVIGSSHIANGTVCQDNSTHSCENELALAIVCDGHGDKKYFRSDVGAKMATDIGVEAIRSFMSKKDTFIHDFVKEFESRMCQLEKYIIYKWNEAVKSHLENHPFTEQELAGVSSKDRMKYESGLNIESAYGTTFLAVVRTEDLWFALQIGDPDCVVVYEDGTFDEPIPVDEKCQFNVTTSLCDKDAIKNFRHCYSEKFPIAAFVSTDGVSNSFKNKTFFHNFVRQILISFSEMPVEEAGQELLEYLPRLSATGSGDDVSIALIYDAAIDFKKNTKTKTDGIDEQIIVKKEKRKRSVGTRKSTKKVVT